MNSTLFLLGAVGLAWLAFAARYTTQAVWCLLLWIPIQGWVQLNVFNDSSATVLIYEIQIIGLYLVFGLRALRGQERFAPPRVMLFALPFVLWVCLLIPYSLSTNGVLLTLIGLRTDLLPIPLLWIGYCMFQERRQLENLSALLLLQLVLVAAVAFTQLAGLSSISGTIFEVPAGFTATRVLRPPGTFSAPVHLGMYILFAIPFGLGLLGLRVSMLKRLCFAAGLAAATVALMVNTQRATIVLLAMTLPLILVLARRRQAVLKVGIALCVLLVGGAIGNRLAGTVFQERVASIATDLRQTVITNPNQRMRDALETPLLGRGLGIASPGLARLQPGNTRASSAPVVRRAVIEESFMAALVSETGVLGLLLFYLLIGAVMYQGLLSVRRCRATDMALLAAALFTFQVAILLQSWPYDPLHYPPSRVTFWIWAGVLLVLPRLAVPVGQAQRRQPPVPTRRLVARRGPPSRTPARAAS